MQPIILSILITWLGATVFTVGVFLLADRLHRQDVASLHEAYARVLDTKANIERYGVAELPPAATADPEPIDREIAEAVATEEMIERGVNSLRETYAGIGIQATDEELRDEVLSIISHPGAPRFQLPALAEAALAGQPH